MNERSDEILPAVGRWFADLGWVDTVALALLLTFLVRGLVRGFVWQVAGLAGLVGGLALAKTLGPSLRPTLSRMFPVLQEQEHLDSVTAFFTVFVAVLFIVYVMARVLRGLIDRLHLDSYDRLLGSVFGVLQAAAFIVVSVSFLSLFEPLQESLAKSRTGRMSGDLVDRGGPFFPDELKTILRDTLDRWGPDMPSIGDDGEPDSMNEPRVEPSSDGETEPPSGDAG